MSKKKQPKTYTTYDKWDPTNVDPNTEVSSSAIFRVKKDLMNIFSEPPPGLFVTTDDSDIMLIHAIIIGPIETPYEGGFFYFILRCPSSYPIEPPRVKLMTTDAGKVRFNPNLYKNGMICLSILGTWSGPSWSPIQQIGSLLMSIQSLMNDKPYYNEPGVKSERLPGDCGRYNDIIQHETLRVAVCGMLENECHLSIPKSLCDIMEKNFLIYHDQFVTIAQSKLSLDGQTMRDPFDERYERGIFRFAQIIIRLNKLHEKLSKRWENASTSSGNSDNSI